MKLRDHLTEAKERKVKSPIGRGTVTKTAVKRAVKKVADMTGYDFSELINSRQEINDGIWQIEEFFMLAHETKGLKQLKKFKKEWAKLDDILDFHL